MDADIIEGLRPLAVPVANIAPLPGNPNRGDVAKVRKSYERFGQRKPIVCVREGEDAEGRPTGTVIAGNTSLAAATELGWGEIAAVWTEDDETTAKAFALMDNKSARSGYDDPDALAAFLKELYGTDLFDATGYDVDDYDDLMATLDEMTPSVTETIERDVERFNARQVRSIVLDFNTEAYKYVVEAAGRARDHFGVASTAEAFKALLDEWAEENPA